MLDDIMYLKLTYEDGSCSCYRATTNIEIIEMLIEKPIDPVYLDFDGELKYEYIYKVEPGYFVEIPRNTKREVFEEMPELEGVNKFANSFI